MFVRISHIILQSNMSTTNNSPPQEPSLPSQPVRLNNFLDSPPRIRVNQDSGSEVKRDLEIVGLRASNNGRSCTMHNTCGASLRVGDVLRLVSCVVNVDGSFGKTQMRNPYRGTKNIRYR